jgi:hypothetical protein
MTLIPWVDAAYAPTLAEAQAAHAEGYRACGFYLPGVLHTDPTNVWTPAQVAVLRQAGLIPVPIVVPDPNLDGDPVAAADAAYNMAVGAFGLPTRMSCLYSGNHLEQTGQITGPIWMPNYGPAPTNIGPGSAAQWSSAGNIAGWSVDLDEAAPDFPFDHAIVVDYEHSTTGGASGVSWYNRFQARIAERAGAPPVPPPPVPLPPGVIAVSKPPVATVCVPGLGGGDYWVCCSDGGIFGFGQAPFLGSLGGKPLTAPIVGMAPTPSGHGYWLVGADGGVFAFGDARFLGSAGAQHLAQPVVGIAATVKGDGYWLAAADGGVFAFGAAPFYGSMGGVKLNASVVGIAASADGGYLMVGADGGVFNFGAASFGSLGGKHLTAPVVGMASTPTGEGYWLVGADGGVFTFGDASFCGSEGSASLAKPILGMTATPSGRGYLLTGRDGGLFAFGDARYSGRVSFG